MKPKFNFLTTGIITLISATGIARASTDDIILQSKVDAPSLTWVLDKTSVLMTNTNLGPMLSGTTDLLKTPEFSFAELADDPNFLKLVASIGQVFNVNTDQASIRITIPKIYYNIHKLTANPHSLQVNDPLLTVNADVSIQGLDISLPSGIQLDLMIPNPTTHVPESFLTAMVDPNSVTIPDSLPPASFGITLQAIRDQQIAFNVQSENLDSLPAYVHTYQNQLIIKDVASQGPITVDHIHISPVTVRLGALTRSFTFDEFKPLIQSKMNALIGSVVSELGDSLKTDIGPTVLASIFSNKLSSDFELDNDSLYANYQVSKFSEPASDQFALTLDGAVCTGDLYKKYQTACVSHSLPYTPERVISDSDYAQAKTEVTTEIAGGGAKFAVSMSEEYINKLLKATIDANLWDSMLASDHLTLGPKGAFVVFNKASESPELILDLNYVGDGSFLQKMMINASHPLHFPLRVSTIVSFGQDGSVPNMTIQIGKILSDANEIVNGIAAYGLSSQLVAGFKGTVAKMILKMASDMNGKKALEMDLPMLKDMSLETTFFSVSAFGRMNLYFKP
jgi:hypothetical protein